MVRLADYVMEWLKTKGVDTVFTVSGGGSIFLCDALAQAEGLNYVCCHHEQAVAMATEGYTRASGRIGVGLVTTGPGGTNAVTGTACAWIDSIPQFFISGQVYLKQTIADTGLRQLGVQEVNIVDIVAPITKYAIMVEDKETIKFHLEKAYHLAVSGRPGPVWIDIPADIQNAQIDPATLTSFEVEAGYNPPEVSDGDLEIVAHRLMNCTRPLIHVGQGVRSPKAQKALLQLVERHGLPVATTWNATDVIDSSHPNFVGRPGAYAERGANFIVQNTECYLAVGTRLPFMVTGYDAKDFARRAYRIMVDIDPAEISKDSLDIDLPLKGDAAAFFEGLARVLPDDWRLDPSWLEACQNMRAKYPIILPEYKTQEEWINSYYFIDRLSEILDRDSVVVTDMGLSFVGTHQAFRVKAGQRIFTNSGHAPMGWGLPATIGAAMAAPGKTIICLAGDGGIMLNIQELATVMHNKIPLKVFIYNNDGYLTIKQTQQLGFEGRLMGSTPESGLSFPDFAGIAEAHAIKFKRVRTNTELDGMLADFIAEPGPAICELIMDPEQPQIPKTINKRNPDGSIQPTALEDMYPFLDPEEVKSNLMDD